MTGRDGHDQGVPSGDPRVVLYADGGAESLHPSDRDAFERELRTSNELRSNVARARNLRTLLSDLPRRRAPLPDLDLLLEQLDAEPGVELKQALASLPRRLAPSGLYERIVARLPRRVPLKVGFRQLAAAAVLLASSLLIYQGALDRRPQNSRLAGVTFEFEVIRYQPGDELDEGARMLKPYVPKPAFDPERLKGMGGRK